MKSFFVGIFLLLTLGVSAQEEQNILPLDLHYLEDQIYIGITYNFLLQQPKDITQRSLSYGLQAGIIKDIPINSERTKGLGIGIGYGIYSYYSNLRAIPTAGIVDYSVIESSTKFLRNKVENHMLEVPIEFRWRNSTATEFKFWRIYTGIKLGYLLGARSKFIGENEHITFTNSDVNKFQYGLTFNFGYNTFNIHAYYGLNTLFNTTAQIDGESIVMKPLRLGFIFYIL